jgi:3-hydroxybutyrate dehydrogenase
MLRGQSRAPVKEHSMLKGKTALVTGSTSGIGKGIAERLAQDGANIVLNGFGDRDEIEQQRRQLSEAHGVEVLYIGADMTKQDEIEGMIRQVHDTFGALEILVNNAGIQYVAPIEQFPVEKWDQIIALQLTAAFHTIRLTVPRMKEKGWGRIINMCSAHSLTASPDKSAYVTAKHGLAGLTKTVALETATKGITVNGICPGYVHTPLVDKQIPETAKARGISEEEVVKNVILAAQPTKKFVPVTEVAALAAFLASDEASSITGALLSIDGGWTAA